VLQRTGLARNRLEIKITDTALIKDAEVAMQVLRPLKRLGVRIVLDDFGTGYSSLSNLHCFPFDQVKILKSFRGLFFVPNDWQQGDAVPIIYVHVPFAWLASAG
jgi:predicted signal transduction protein with EAL and GGDEF domain